MDEKNPPGLDCIVAAILASKNTPSGMDPDEAVKEYRRILFQVRKNGGVSADSGEF